MNKKILLGFALLLISAGYSAKSEASCWVYTSSDSSSNIDSLRYRISNYNGFGSSDGDCTPTSADASSGYEQAIKFSTTELGYAYQITNNTITISSGSSYSIGNAYYTLVMGNASSSDGVITIDARTNNLNHPFTCRSISNIKDITLRNMIILVKDDLDYDDVMSDESCLVAGDNLCICHTDTSEDCDPSDCLEPGESTEETEPVDLDDTDVDGYYESGDGDPYTRNDCDDNDANIHPGAEEICDGIDNDCDGRVDEGATIEGKETYYLDADADGYYDDTNPDASVRACDPPSADYVTTLVGAGDCNDDATTGGGGVNPNVEEICGDTIDQNCDETDPACEICDNVVDDNGDGFADCDDAECIATGVCDGSIETDCADGEDNDEIDGIDSDGIDCADSDCSVATNCLIETECDDGITNDADELIDCEDDDCSADAACTPSNVNVDEDSDGISTPDDCNDLDSSVYPGAPEICGSCSDPNDVSTCVSDGEDQNCDGQLDEGCAGSPYLDDDGDGYCEDATQCADNSLPADCNDAGYDTNPGAAEMCDDLVDNNCDGEVDESLCDVNVAPPVTGCGCDLTAHRPQMVSLLAMMLLALIPYVAGCALRARKFQAPQGR